MYCLLSYGPYLPRYGHRSNLEVEDNIYRGKEMVQQVEDQQKQRLRFPNLGLTLGWILFSASPSLQVKFHLQILYILARIKSSSVSVYFCIVNNHDIDQHINLHWFCFERIYKKYPTGRKSQTPCIILAFWGCKNMHSF